MFTSFIPPASASALDACGANYKRWDNVTRDPLSPDVLELVPELLEFVPPAGVIDRLGFGSDSLLHRSDRATASDEVAYDYLGCDNSRGFSQSMRRQKEPQARPG